MAKRTTKKTQTKVASRAQSKGPALLADPKPDISVQIREKALNGFLGSHFKANKSFYNRTKEPLWETTIPVGNGQPKRVLKISGKVIKALELDLSPITSVTAREYNAWWKSRVGGAQSLNAEELPPNVKINTMILIIAEFTNRKNPNKLHRLTYQFDLSVAAYLSIQQDSTGKAFLKAEDWKIEVDSLGIDENGDPAKPVGDEIGQTSPVAACEKQLAELRAKITDLFDLGAQYAISRLSDDLTYKLPLPPLTDIVKGVDVAYDKLTIANNAIALSAFAQSRSLSELVQDEFAGKAIAVQQAFSPEVVEKLSAEKGLKTQAQIERWMRGNVPEYRELDDEYAKNLKNVPGFRSMRQVSLNRDVEIVLGDRVFDILAKKYLDADKQKCQNVFSIDIAVAYGGVKACYKVQLVNAQGGIDGNKVFMGCDVDVAGWASASVCVRNPCGKDPCAGHAIGIGLRGPLQGGLRLEQDERRTRNGVHQALRVRGFVDKVPGLYIIGLPPIIRDLANAILSAATSFLMKAFLNSLLKALTLYIVEVPVQVPGTKVKTTLSNWQVGPSANQLGVGFNIAYRPKP